MLLVGQSIKGVMFHANDAGKHDVYWSELGQHWVVENEKDGLLHTFDTLCAALTNMHVRTNTVGKYAREYALLVPNTWTVSHNPYN